MEKNFDKIEDAIEEIRKGKIVVVLDNEDRENEGDLICAAEFATPENINFIATYAKGLICIPMDKAVARKFHLEPMTYNNTDNHETAFTISIDHVDTSTGISAFDRSLTAMKLTDTDSTASDFRKPGHMFPLVAKEHGLFVRQGHTEATVDLCKLAGLQPCGICCEIMADDGHMASYEQLVEFSKKHNLKMIRISDLAEYKKRKERIVEKEAEAKLPTKYGDFKMSGYRNIITGSEIAVLSMGDITENDSVLCRMHSECMTGDTFGSLKCDCGQQLDKALSKIADEGKGVLIYLRQEGRGIGLINKMKAYSLQEKGFDTIEANEKLGFKADLREYTEAIQILEDMKIKKVRLMTNNPEKLDSIELCTSGIEVTERVPLETEYNPQNINYIKTKKIRMGHMFTSL